MKTNPVNMFSPVNEIMHGDPFLRFLRGRGLEPVTVVFIGVCYGLICSVVIPITQKTIEQVLSDWPELLRTLAVTPLLLGYYFWQPDTIQNLYDWAVDRLSNRSSRDVYQLFGLTQALGYRAWFWLAIIFGLSQSAIYYFSLLGRPPGWQNSNGLIISMSSLMTFLSFYVTLHIAFRQVIAMRGINKFFRSVVVDIAPLHPDHAGGLKPLGQYVVNIGFGVGIFGLALGISLVRSRMGLEQLELAFFINLGIYVLAAPAFFFIPLLDAHRLMRKAKENILAEVSAQYESLYLTALGKMKAGKSMDKEMAQMDAVRKMYAIADDSPVWPFNINMFSRFSAAIILPVVLPLVIDYFTDLVKQFLTLFM